jgi:DNA invertase Pin-like site-specific DNA recombinase
VTRNLAAGYVRVDTQTGAKLALRHASNLIRTYARNRSLELLDIAYETSEAHARPLCSQSELVRILDMAEQRSIRVLN